MEQIQNFMTVDEAATLWKVRPERIIYTCECGEINGSARLSDQWIIPMGIERPKIKRLPIETDQSEKSDSKRTELQQMFIDAFEHDSLPTKIIQQKIGKKTFTIVCRHPNDAKYTYTEMGYNIILGEMERTGINISSEEREEILRCARRYDINQRPTLTEYLEGMKENLIEAGFSDEDISMMLDKYAEHYHPIKPL